MFEELARQHAEWMEQDLRVEIGYNLSPRQMWTAHLAEKLLGKLAMYDVDPHDVTIEITESTAMADFPAVVKSLEAQPQGDPPTVFQKGFAAWKRSRAAEDDAAGLLNEIRKARLENLKREVPELYEEVAAEGQFPLRWERARRYWLTCLFEFLFLAGLLVFAAIPWVRGAGRLSWSIHLGLVPVLLFVPFWLGYVPLAFTSAWPSGGVVYPSLIIHFRGVLWTGLDTAFIEHVPKVLEPLWQPTGECMALTGLGAVGPVAAVGIGILVGGVTFGLGTLRCYIRKPKTECGGLT